MIRGSKWVLRVVFDSVANSLRDSQRHWKQWIDAGVSATHIDWTMVPYVRKSFFKHYIDGCKYILDRDDEWIAENITDYVNKDTCVNDEYGIEAAFWQMEPKAYQYALDMTEKETYQAVEGMYHNLNFGRFNSNVKDLTCLNGENL